MPAMRSGSKKILVAPAWPYAAGFRHLGHAAAYVPFDVFARYHRLRGNDVLAVSGTDEHGTPVMVVADSEGKSYREVADFYNRAHREDFRRQLGQKWPGFEAAQIERTLAAANFRGVSVTSLPPDREAKGPALFVASGVKT